MPRVCAHSGHSVWRTHYNGGRLYSATSAGLITRIVSEMRRLQQRVRDLEAELVRLQDVNDTLAAEVGPEMLLLIGNVKPALT